MTETQLLWSINTGLMGIVLFFVKSWMTKVDTKIETKVEIKHCDEQRKDIKDNCDKLFRHKHAPVSGGGKGEVIIP